MKASVLRSGAWILALLGAYAVGSWHPLAMSRKEAPGSAGQAATKKDRSVVAPAGSDSQERVTKEWLGKYKTGSAAISGDRMKAATEAVLADTDLVQSTANFARLLADLTAENAPFVLQALLASNSEQKGRLMALLGHAWGAMDGKGALTAMNAMGALRGRDGAAAKSAALSAWADLDPELAFRFMDETKSSDRREAETLARAFLSGVARRDADAALAYLSKMPQEMQPDLINAIIQQKLSEGVEVSAAWALKLPQEDMRTNALETVGETYLRQDLDGALKWAQSIATRPDSHEAVADIANEYASRDPGAASAWAAALPAGDGQNHAMEDIFENWASKDAAAASQHLTTMPAGDAKDYAIQAYSRTVSRSDPMDALKWAASISDAGQRADLQVEIARRWQSNSPAEAQAWIAGNLPADLQARTNGPKR